MAYKNKTDTVRYNNDFNKQQYDRISLMLPKGCKEKVRAHAVARGETVNGFINRVIVEGIARDNGTEPINGQDV